MKPLVWAIAIIGLMNALMAQVKQEGYIELVEWRTYNKPASSQISIQLAVHFPDDWIPENAASENPFHYQLLLQVENSLGTLVYTRTINRQMNTYPRGQVDTLNVSFTLPAGKYRLFVTPLRVPVYIQDLQGVPLIVNSAPPLP